MKRQNSKGGSAKRKHATEEELADYPDSQGGRLDAVGAALKGNLDKDLNDALGDGDDDDDEEEEDEEEMGSDEEDEDEPPCVSLVCDYCAR
jgi:hypothetical protein